MLKLQQQREEEAVAEDRTGQQQLSADPADDAGDVEFWDAKEAPSAVELLQALDFVEREAIEATIHGPADPSQAAAGNSQERLARVIPTPGRGPSSPGKGGIPVAGGALTTTAAKQITHMQMALDRAHNEMDKLRAEVQSSHLTQRSLEDSRCKDRRRFLVEQEAGEMAGMALEAQATELSKLRAQLEEERARGQAADQDYNRRLELLEDRSIPQSSAAKIAEALAGLKSL